MRSGFSGASAFYGVGLDSSSACRVSFGCSFCGRGACSARNAFAYLGAGQRPVNFDFAPVAVATPRAPFRCEKAGSRFFLTSDRAITQGCCFVFFFLNKFLATRLIERVNRNRSGARFALPPYPSLFLGAAPTGEKRDPLGAGRSRPGARSNPAPGRGQEKRRP